MIRRFAIPASAAVAVLAFYIIAPSPNSSDGYRSGVFGGNRDVASASFAAWSLGDTLRALNSAVLRAKAWETARALPADGAATKVIVLPGLESNTESLFEQTARRELGALEGARVPIRIVLAPDSQQGSGWYRKQTVIPQNTEQPCVVVVGLSPRARNLRMGRNDRLLGTCGFYAKFGYPGNGMRDWLVESRGIAAETDTLLAEPRQSLTQRELMGAMVGEVPAVAACLAGDDNACALSLSLYDPLGPRAGRAIVPVNERTSHVFLSYASVSWYGPGQNLAELRAHLGDRRFEQVWTSAQGPADAYKTVTGEHIAAFARPILLREMLPHQRGPLRGDLSVLFALTLGAAAAIVAIKRTRRERSGT